MCECAETYYINTKTGRQVHIDPPPKLHNCDYVIRRNQLIEGAAQIAGGHSAMLKNPRFAKRFTIAMDYAVKEHGLLS